jgi:hypothetical protein
VEGGLAAPEGGLWKARLARSCYDHDVSVFHDITVIQL